MDSLETAVSVLYTALDRGRKLEHFVETQQAWNEQANFMHTKVGLKTLTLEAWANSANHYATHTSHENTLIYKI